MCTAKQFISVKQPVAAHQGVSLVIPDSALILIMSIVYFLEVFGCRYLFRVNVTIYLVNLDWARFVTNMLDWARFVTNWLDWARFVTNWLDWARFVTNWLRFQTSTIIKNISNVHSLVTFLGRFHHSRNITSIELRCIGNLARRNDTRWICRYNLSIHRDTSSLSWNIQTIHDWSHLQDY